MAAQVALRRQQAQEEAEARELGIRLLRTEADLERDGGDNLEESVEDASATTTVARASTPPPALPPPPMLTLSPPKIKGASKRKASKLGKC